jgi:hypothetical protein
MIDIILLAALCGIAGIVVRNILTDPGMVLAPLYNLIVNRWKLPEWVTKPMVDCSYCIAGQWALWAYLYCYWSQYNPVHHVLCITTAIFTVDILTMNFKYD